MKMFNVDEWEFVKGSLITIRDKNNTEVLANSIFNLDNVCVNRYDKVFTLSDGRVCTHKPKISFYPTLFNGKYYYTYGGDIEGNLRGLYGWTFCEVKLKKTIKNYTGSNLCVSIPKNKKS